MTRLRFQIFAAVAALILFQSPEIKAQTLAGMSGVQWLDQVERDRKKASPLVWVSADVQGIDIKAGEATISHGPIARVQMPAMTMTFPVKDLAHLRKMKRGDRIEFQTRNDSGVVRITNVRMLH